MKRAHWRIVVASLLAAGWTRAAFAQAPSSVPGWSDRFAPVAPPELDANERARLEAGEIVMRELEPSSGDGVASLMMGLIDATPDQVWQVMADCGDQDQWMPRISSASVRDRQGDDHTCDLVVDLPFPAPDARSSSRQHARRLPDGGYQRHWELAPGPSTYERYGGSWNLHPYAQGRRTLLVNRVDIAPKSAVPVWLLGAVYRREAPVGFEAIRKRVHARGVSAAGARNVSP